MRLFHTDVYPLEKYGNSQTPGPSVQDTYPIRADCIALPVTKTTYYLVQKSEAIETPRRRKQQRYITFYNPGQGRLGRGLGLL
jgi:hypothetical protein